MISILEFSMSPETRFRTIFVNFSKKQSIFFSLHPLHNLFSQIMQNFSNLWLHILFKKSDKELEQLFWLIGIIKGKTSFPSTSCPSIRELSKYAKYKKAIKNQLFIMPIYRRISERSCSNLLEIFFIRTSFSFSSMFDSGECGRNVDGVVFFISDYS